MPTLYETSLLCLQAELSSSLVSELGWRVFEGVDELGYAAKCYFSERQSIIAVVHQQEYSTINKVNIDKSLTFTQFLIEDIKRQALSHYKIIHTGYMSSGVYAQLCGYHFGHAAYAFENPAWKQYIVQLPENSMPCLIKQYSILSHVNTVGQLANVLLINMEDRASSRTTSHFFPSSKSSYFSLENIVKLFQTVPTFDPAIHDQLPSFLTEDFCFLESSSGAEDHVNVTPEIQIFTPPGNEDLVDQADPSFFRRNADNPIIYYQCDSRIHSGYTLDQKHWLISHVSAFGKFSGHSMIIIEGIKPPLSATSQAKLFVGYFHLVVDRESGAAKIICTQGETYKENCIIYQAVSWKCEKSRAMNFIRNLELERSDAIKYKLLTNIEPIGDDEGVHHNCATWVLAMLEKHAGIPNPRITWNHVVAKPMKNTKEKNQADHPDLLQTQWSPFSHCVVS